MPGSTSNDPEARARSLANLNRNPPRPPLGNTRALTHGGKTTVATADLTEARRELYDALSDAAPLREVDGSLPRADEASVEVAALALHRWRSVSRWLDLHGRLDEKTGAVKPAADLELRHESALHRALDVLGLNPAARAKLGLNVARAFDLASALSEPDEEES
ncbi:MAG: hypothetical protein H0U42_03840 [Thermoleophilaceae bacterium]|nr:hypothetical protein [Thermoleophilaceae bacterium]